MDLTVRLARPSDCAALDALIVASCTVLLPSFYTPGQISEALGRIFGVDEQLIADGTFFVVDAPDGSLAACGGWSRRAKRCGGRLAGSATEEAEPQCHGCGEGAANMDGKALLIPGRDAARIRAFFVHPAYARKGLGRRIMAACEDAISAEGFTAVDVAATLNGSLLYTAAGYSVTSEEHMPLAGQPPLHVIHLHKDLNTMKDAADGEKHK